MWVLCGELGLFELLYDRTVRGPMKVLKELWIKEINDPQVKTTYQYTLDLRDRLQSTCEVAMNKLEKLSKRYRKSYNHRAKAKKIKVNDKVPVLLPTKANKLLIIVKVHTR